MAIATKGRRVLLSLVLAITAMAAFAPASQAWNLETFHHDWTLKSKETSPGNVCCYNYWKVTGNIASYEGAGTVGVCQRTWDDTSDVWREGCANNHVGNALNLTPYYGHLLVPQVKNNSAWTHTIDHYWYVNVE